MSSHYFAVSLTAAAVSLVCSNVLSANPLYYQTLELSELKDGYHSSDDVMTPGEGEDAQPTYTARGDEEMQRLTQLVRSAVGFNAERGDIVEVVNTQFARAAAPAAAAEPGMFGFLGNLDVTRIIEIVAALFASLAVEFGVSSTTALISSPKSSFGTPNTATSATAG
jgi:hypothetical protein